MTASTENKTNTLGDWALLAIDKHLQKVLSHEANVIADREPEDLHQMRVGMRRLRSAMTGFAPVVDLPKSAQENKVGKVARILGELRDLDVLRAALEEYKPALPSKEQKVLAKALTQMAKVRSQTFAKVKRTLQDDYQSLKQALLHWLQQPTYQKIAQIPLKEVLPDLLLPEVSKLLLHPGWLVGCEVKEGEITIQNLKPKAVEQTLATQGVLLHSLRKEAKRARYQMEVFSEFYDKAYNAYLDDVKEVQSILGRLQDNHVLSAYMSTLSKNEIKDSLPTLAKQLAHSSYEAWQEWQSVQQRFLNVETRKNFHAVILQPTFEQDSENGKE